MTTQTKIADPLTVRGRIQHYKNEFPVHYEFPQRKDHETEEEYQKRKQRTRGAMNGNFSKILKSVIVAYPDEAKVSDRVALYRRLILSWVLTPDDDAFEDRSSAEYLDADWFGISKWQGSYFDDESQSWKLRDGFHDEVLQILHCAKEDYVFVLKGEHPISMNDIQKDWNKIFQTAKAVNEVLEDVLLNGDGSEQEELGVIYIDGHDGQNEISETVYPKPGLIDIQIEPKHTFESEKQSGLFVPEPIQQETANEFAQSLVDTLSEPYIEEEEPFPYVKTTEAIISEDYDPFDFE